MRIRKVFTYFTCLIILVYSIVPTVSIVNAGAMWDKLGKESKEAAKVSYTYLTRADGWTMEAACGVLANADRETSLDAKTGITENTGASDKGMFQMNGARGKRVVALCNGLSSMKDLATTQTAYLCDHIADERSYLNDYSGGKNTLLSNVDVGSANALKAKCREALGIDGKCKKSEFLNKIKTSNDGVIVAGTVLTCFERAHCQMRFNYSGQKCEWACKSKGCSLGCAKSTYTSNEDFYKSIYKAAQKGSLETNDMGKNGVKPVKLKYEYPTSNSSGGAETTTSNLGGDLEASNFYVTGSSQMVSALKNSEQTSNIINFSSYREAKINDIKSVLGGGTLALTGSEGDATKYQSGGSNGDSIKVFVIMSGDQEITKKNGKSLWVKYKKEIDSVVSDGKKGAIICSIPYQPSSKGEKGAVNKQIKIFNEAAQSYASKTDLVTYIGVNDISDIKSKALKGKKDSWDSGTKAYKDTSNIAKEIKKKIDTSITSYISADTAAKKNSEDKKQTESNSKVKVTGQVYDESYFLTANKDLIDSPLLMPDKDMMTVNEQTQVARWAENIDNKEVTVVNWLRTLIAFLGIMITIYSVFIYLAYWLDRVNNIIPFWVLPTITLGQLVVSPDDTSSFNPEVQGKKAVIHKDIIKIVVIGCTLGVLLMTGQIYNIIGFIWDKVHSFLGGI